MRKRSVFYRLGAGVAAASLVAGATTGAVAQGPGSGGGGGRPVAESAGNNLSYPMLIASDGTGTGPVLRGTEYAPALGTLPSDYLVLPDGSRAYYQQNANNTWQASNSAAGCSIGVDLVNWGDNLESKDWAYRQVVRVETQLYDAVGATMPDGGPTVAYEMAKTNDLSGINEMWGLHTTAAAVPVTYVPTTSFVYTQDSRLSIQKIDPASATELSWVDGKWVGPGAGAVVVDVATKDAADGRGGYAGEISVSGNFVYGYVWNTKTLSDGVGEYRLTFSLDGLPTDCVSVAGASIMPSVESEVTAAAEAAGNVAVIDAANNLTFIDVGLTSSKGGRK